MERRDLTAPALDTHDTAVNCQHREKRNDHALVNDIQNLLQSFRELADQKIDPDQSRPADGNVAPDKDQPRKCHKSNVLSPVQRMLERAE